MSTTILTRTDISAADSVVSAVTLAGTNGANLFLVRDFKKLELQAASSLAGGQLTVRAVYYNRLGAPISVSEPITFTTSPITDTDGTFLPPRQFLDTGDAVSAYIFVESVSLGTWKFNAFPAAS